MIRNYKYLDWKIDRNLSWVGDRLDEREDWIREAHEETYEEELLRTSPADWIVVQDEALREPAYA